MPRYCFYIQFLRATSTENQKDTHEQLPNTVWDPIH